jgi:hypothetical protein
MAANTIGTRLASDCCNSAAPKAVVRCVGTTRVLGWHINSFIYRLRWLFTHCRLLHGLRDG